MMRIFNVFFLSYRRRGRYKRWVNFRLAKNEAEELHKENIGRYARKSHLCRFIDKNVAKQINTVVSKDEKQERRVLTRRETELFLKQAEGSFYYNLYVVALETGLQIGEIMGLTWSDIDLKKDVACKAYIMLFSKRWKVCF